MAFRGGLRLLQLHRSRIPLVAAAVPVVIALGSVNDDDDDDSNWNARRTRVELGFGNILRQCSPLQAFSSFPPIARLESSSETDLAKSEQCLSRYAIAEAAARAAPGVVNITVSLGANLFLRRESGSGFIIQPNGLILTNAHVVINSGRGLHEGKIVVTLHDGRSFPAHVVNLDVVADIALLKIECDKPLPVVKLGTSRNLRPGEWVVAVGSPLHLHNTVTSGIISAVERKSAEIGMHGASTDYIQTDASINQGNSGGPLLNLNGEVIGINTIKALSADGVSFAIPIDTVVKVINQLYKHGHVVRPWLGMKMLELNGPIIAQLKERDPFFPKVQNGVLVPQVIPGSPAEKGGIRAGDVIVEFDGKPVETISDIIESLGDNVGVSFEVVVKRSRDVQTTVNVVPEEATPR